MAKKPQPKPVDRRTWDQLTDPETDFTGLDEAGEDLPMEVDRHGKQEKPRGKKPPSKP